MKSWIACSWPPTATQRCWDTCISLAYKRLAQVKRVREGVHAGAQAGLLGRDLRRHAEFAVAPGGVREVALATEARDDSPRTFACPRPPACV